MIFIRTLTNFYLAISISLLTATQAPAEDSFSPSLWKEQLKHQTDHQSGITFISRGEEFKKFLRDYNLIGMSRSQVNSLLGYEDANGAYTVMSGPDNSSGVQLEFENEKVKQWRLKGFRGKSAWQTTNVLWTLTGFPPKVDSSQMEKKKAEVPRASGTPAN